MNLSEFIAKVSTELINYNQKRGNTEITIQIKVLDALASYVHDGPVDYDVEGVGFDENHGILYIEFNRKENGK